LFAILFAFVAFAACQNDERLDFVLEYRGNCSRSNFGTKGECDLRAQSEEVITHISGNGKVRTEIIRIIGSISRLRFTDSMFANNSYAASGNVTFGVHQNHEQHKLHFVTLGTGRQTQVPDPSTEFGFALVLGITRGEGALSGAYGTITLNGVAFTKTGEVILGALGIVWLKKPQSEVTIS